MGQRVLLLLWVPWVIHERANWDFGVLECYWFAFTFLWFIQVEFIGFKFRLNLSFFSTL